LGGLFRGWLWGDGRGAKRQGEGVDGCGVVRDGGLLAAVAALVGRTVDSVTVITDDYIPLLPLARTTVDPTLTPIVFPSPQMTISMNT